MNFEACLKATINDSVVHALERMKTLDPESRSQLFLEMSDWIFCDFDTSQTCGRSVRSCFFQKHAKISAVLENKGFHVGKYDSWRN